MVWETSERYQSHSTHFHFKCKKVWLCWSCQRWLKIPVLTVGAWISLGWGLCKSCFMPDQSDWWIQWPETATQPQWTFWNTFTAIPFEWIRLREENWLALSFLLGWGYDQELKPRCLIVQKELSCSNYVTSVGSPLILWRGVSLKEDSCPCQECNIAALCRRATLLK